jgi:hypothetical protein
MKGRRIFAILVVVVLLCMLLSDSSRDTENAGVTFPVLTDMVLDSGSPEFLLQNPVENKGRYLLKYEFMDTATDDVFFSTNWLEGGKQYSYRLDGLEGSVDSSVHIYAKDADTYGNVSGVNLYIKITKGE